MSTRVSTKDATPRMAIQRGVPNGVYRPNAIPPNTAGIFATNSSRTSIPIRSNPNASGTFASSSRRKSPYGSRAIAAETPATTRAARFTTPAPAYPHAIPNNIVASSKPTCGLQKQFCPGQAFSVLYCPMMKRPPRSPMTAQFAVPNTQPAPNHSAKPIAMTDATVSAPLYQLPNRLPRTHPAAPTLMGGGGSASNREDI